MLKLNYTGVISVPICCSPYCNASTVTRFISEIILLYRSNVLSHVQYKYCTQFTFAHKYVLFKYIHTRVFFLILFIKVQPSSHSPPVLEIKLPVAWHYFWCVRNHNKSNLVFSFDFPRWEKIACLTSFPLPILHLSKSNRCCWQWRTSMEIGCGRSISKKFAFAA